MSVSDEEFIEFFKMHGATGTAKKLQLTLRSVFERRRRLEKRLNIKLIPPSEEAKKYKSIINDQEDFKLKDGIILVGSDAHYWPSHISTAHRAFVKFCENLKPSAVVLNGDVLDGASISRHAKIAFEYTPTVVEEIETCQERLSEIEAAIPSQCKKYWTMGNHDLRLESRLANLVPEYAKVHGFQIKDHFPYWNTCMSLWVNNDLIIKHRFKGGTHATHNNTLWAGKSICTGHLHSLRVTAFNDYNPNTRYGIDCGTLCDVYGQQFSYNENSPVNWRSGFIVLTFKNKELLWPEIVHVMDDGKAQFRGEIFNV